MNDLQRTVARMCRELLENTGQHMEARVASGEYGGMKSPLLFGSEQLSAAYPREAGDYYGSVLVTVDFSGSVCLLSLLLVLLIC